MIALGFLGAAFLGAVARALITDLDSPFDRQVRGTAVVNALGAFLLGLLHTSSASALVIIGVGGLGTLTTFSTFISQVDFIDREGSRRDAVLYLLGTLVLGIAAGWVGWLLA